MKLSKARGLGLLLILTLSAPVLGAHTLYSKIPIPPQCERDYQKGNAFLTQSVQKGLDLNRRAQVITTFDTALNRYAANDECRFYFSVGMFDAQGMLQQLVILEYLLELQFSFEKFNALGRWELKKYYARRLQSVGVHQENLKELAEISKRSEIVTALVRHLNSAADEKKQAVTLGRFVFVGNHYPPFTLFDYASHPNGSWKRDAKGNEVLTTGSYHRIAQESFQRALNVAKEYLDWRPGIFFSEDSYWYGAWWRYWNKDYQSSLREVKQDGYEKLYFQHLHFAESLKIDTREFRKIYSHMVAKERAILARELGAYEKMYDYRWAPLLVPVGMYAGAALFANSTWFSAVPAGTGSFTYVGGSLALASNASAAVSLLSISAYTGMGGYAAYQDYKERSRRDIPFHFTDTLDYLVGAAYQSFPLAAASPVIVGGLAYSAHELFVFSKHLLSSTITLGKNVQTLGFKGTLKASETYLLKLPGQVIQLPKYVFHSWLQAWYKNPKILLSNYGADILVSLVFDCGYRQVNLQGTDKCTWTDETGTHFNKQFLYSITSTVIVGGITKPVVLIENVGLRWISYRGITLLSSVLSQLIVSGAIDNRRLVFDQAYGSSVSTLKGETERYLRMRKWVLNRSATEQAALLIALRALVLTPVETPIKIYFMDRYVKGELKPAAALKELTKEIISLSLDEYDDAELEEALRKLGQEPEVLNYLSPHP